MEHRLGVIAGSGDFSSHVIREAHKLGYKCFIAAIKGEAEGHLEESVEEFEWFDISDISNVISFFKKNCIKEALFAGKIEHRIIYRRGDVFEKRGDVFPGEEKTPTTLIKWVINLMDGEGIKIIDPSLFISSTFCKEGILTKTKPSHRIEKDIDFGWEIAKSIADLDIGQTVIVKDKAVIAIEGMEGTDEAIKRGGEIAGSGIVVVKVSRSLQDFRVDLPAIGLETIRQIAGARGQALCFEAQKMPFFQKEESVAMADNNKISIIAKRK